MTFCCYKLKPSPAAAALASAALAVWEELGHRHTVEHQSRYCHHFRHHLLDQSRSVVARHPPLALNHLPRSFRRVGNKRWHPWFGAPHNPASEALFKSIVVRPESPRSRLLGGLVRLLPSGSSQGSLSIHRATLTSILLTRVSSEKISPSNVF